MHVRTDLIAGETASPQVNPISQCLEAVGSLAQTINQIVNKSIVDPDALKLLMIPAPQALTPPARSLPAPAAPTKK